MEQPNAEAALTRGEIRTIESLSKATPIDLYHWIFENDLGRTTLREFQAHFHKIISNVATEENLVLKPHVVPSLERAIAHHNALVDITYDVPRTLLANAPHGEYDWKKRVVLSTSDLWITHLTVEAVKADFPDQELDLQYLIVKRGRESPLDKLATVLFGRLTVYQTTLNLRNMGFTIYDIRGEVYRHDLDWLVDVLEGNRDFVVCEDEEVKDSEGNEMLKDSEGDETLKDSKGDEVLKERDV